MAKETSHPLRQADAPDAHVLRVGGIPQEVVAPLCGMPIRCVEVAGSVVDVTLMTRLGVNLKGVKAIVDEGRQAQVEERYRRFRRLSDVSQVVACYLRCHPKVQEVAYPGLKDDPSFSVAARTLVGGFGPFVDYRVGEDWHRFEARECDERTQIMELERLLSEVTC